VKPQLLAIFKNNACIIEIFQLKLKFSLKIVYHYFLAVRGNISIGEARPLVPHFGYALSVARELFLDRGQDRERQNREREKKVFVGIGAFFCPENERFPKKKRSSPDLERFSVPNMAQDTDLRGGKIRPGGAKIFPGWRLPPYFQRLCSNYSLGNVQISYDGFLSNFRLPPPI